jgi:acyl carrier protein
MTRAQVESELKLIIIDQLFVTPDELTSFVDLENDLSADSLDRREIIMAAEDKFQITITDETAAQMRTLADIVNYVCETKGIPRDVPAAQPAKNWPPTYALPAFSPAPAPAPLARDCKSCGAHSVSEKICPYCGRAAH